MKGHWVALGVSSLLATACAADSDDETGAVEVGLLAPYTGEFAAQGVNVERVMLILQDTVNEAGGVAERPLRIVAEDTHSDVGKGLESAERLLDRPSLLALVGPDHDELILAMQEQLLEPGWAYLLPGITASDLAPSEGRYRLGPLAEGLGCALAERVYDLGYRNIVVFHGVDRSNEAFGESVAGTLSAYDLVGPAVTTRIPVGSTPAAMDRALSDASALKPDAIILATSARVGSELVYQWLVSPQSNQADWFLASNLLNPNFLVNVVANGLEGAVGVAPSVAFERDAEGLTQEVEAQFGDEPFVASYYYYDAAVLAALAIEAAAQEAGGVPTREEVTAQIRRVARPPGRQIHWNQIPEALEAIRSGDDVDYVGITGNLTFDSGGDTDHQTMRYRQERVAGERTVFEAYRVCVPVR